MSGTVVRCRMAARDNAFTGAGGRRRPTAVSCDMTTAKPAIPATTTSAYPGRFRLPDPPEREPDEKMTSFKHLAHAGNAYLLAEHLGNPDTTLVAADRWVVADPSYNKARAKRPDMLVAFA